MAITTYIVAAPLLCSMLLGPCAGAEQSGSAKVGSKTAVAGEQPSDLDEQGRRLVHESEISGLPGEYRTLLGNSGWAHESVESKPRGWRRDNGAFKLELSAELPTGKDGTYYVLGYPGENISKASFKARVSRNDGSAGPALKTLIWALDDGKLLIDTQPAADGLSSFDYSFNELHVGAGPILVTVLAVAEDGSMVFADCRPLMPPWYDGGQYEETKRLN